MDTQVALAALFAYALQWLKKASWFPWLTEESTRVAKMLWSAAVALFTALGLTYTWDPANGIFTLSGLTIAHAWTAFTAFVTSFLFQQFTYKALIQKK